MPYAHKQMIFDGAAGRGAVGNAPLFTVTGHVLVILLLPYCVATLTEALATATIALGVAGSTSFWVAATTATDLAAGDFWYDATPTETLAMLVPAGFKDAHINANIVATVAAQAVNGGELDFGIYWERISQDGQVAPA